MERRLRDLRDVRAASSLRRERAEARGDPAEFVREPIRRPGRKASKDMGGFGVLQASHAASASMFEES